MKFLLLLILVPVSGYAAEPPKSPPFVFITQKAACSLIDGKLVLSRAWPFGSWEDCAYSVLSAAQQLDAQRDLLAKQLAEEKAKPAPVCLGSVLKSK